MNRTRVIVYSQPGCRIGLGDVLILRALACQSHSAD
jgi:hypothetical protein